MPDNTIKLILEGHDEGGHVDLTLLLKGLGALKSALLAADRTVHRGRPSKIRYVVSGLSHSSPAEVDISPKYTGEDAGDDRSDEVIECISHAAGQVDSGEIPDDANHELLEALRPLYSMGHQQCQSAQLVLGGRAFGMTERAALAVAQAFAAEGSTWGSVTGALEQINIHGGARIFTLYPRVGPKQVRCAFPEHLRQTAMASLGRRVTVRGQTRYRPHAKFMHAIAAQEMDVLPADDAPPTLGELRGVLKGATDRTAVEIIRESRDEWD